MDTLSELRRNRNLFEINSKSIFFSFPSLLFNIRLALIDVSVPEVVLT